MSGTSTELIVNKLFGTISGKKLAILGFAFKANTNDTRESAAIRICKDLIDEGANLVIHDPKVDSFQITKDLGINPSEEKDIYKNENLNELGKWELKRDIQEVFLNADAAIILTEWGEYSQIDWDQIALKMRKPAWVFDARSITNKEKVINSGLNLWRLGDGSILY